MIPFDDEGFDEEENARLEAERDALIARWDESGLEDKLRKIGVYVERGVHVPVPSPIGTQITYAVQARVNRSAWTERVLDPEGNAVDKQFKAIAVHAKDDEFLDERERILRNIKEGRDPLDDGDGDE